MMKENNKFNNNVLFKEELVMKNKSNEQVAKLERYLEEKGYIRGHYGHSEADGVFYRLEEEDVIYEVEYASDGTHIIEYRCGTSKGCFFVIDGEYDSVDDYINGVMAFN